jgi:hypothetical protein
LNIHPGNILLKREIHLDRRRATMNFIMKVKV